MEAISVLESKPKGIKLFDSVIGECVIFDRVEDDHIICSYNGNTQSYKGNGKVFDNKDAIVVLNPSKQMRDWPKFAWKKGDVLTDGEVFVIFKRWENPDYSQFFAQFEIKPDTFIENCFLYTNEFRKVSGSLEQKAIEKIEEHYGGKLNLSTLKIEQPKQEFKDWEIFFLNRRFYIGYVY